MILRDFGRTRWGRAALSLAAGIAAAVAPPAAFARWRAWRLAGIAALLWAISLYVFFFHFAGPGFLLHLGLWSAGILALLAPRRLKRAEHWLAQKTAYGASR